MRHQNSGRKLNMSATHRKAMFRNMATSLLIHEKIRTTLPRAKELRRRVERLITLGRRGDLHARRLVMRDIKDRKAVARLFDDIGPRFTERPGGYTRIVRIGLRTGDAAQIAQIELMPAEVKKSASKSKAKKDDEADE